MTDAEWLAGARPVIIESYLPPLYPELELDVGRLIDTVREAGANTVRFGTIGYWANYPSDIYPRHPGLGRRDLVGEVLDACHSAGLRFVPYIPLSHPMVPQALDLRPEWAQQDRDGARRPWIHHQGDIGRPFLWRICSRGPYRQAAAGITREIVERYDVDAIYFDGPHYYTPCYCDGCATSFREFAGAELPDVTYGHEEELDWDDPLIRRYWKWVQQTDHAVLQEQVDLIRSVRPEMPVLSHGGPVLHQLYKQPHEDLLQTVDGALFEMGPTFIYRHMVASLTRSTGRLMWSYVGTYNNHPRIFGQGREVTLEGFATLAIGASPLLAPGGRLYYDPEGGMPYVRDVFSFQQQHHDLLAGLEPEPFVALPYSQSTAESFGQGAPGRRYNEPWGAAFELLTAASVQTTPVFESLLDDPDLLRRYRAVYLPNVTVLTEAQQANLDAYVSAGGCVIAAGVTARLLPELCGVDWLEDVWSGHDVYLSAVPSAPDGPQPARLLPLQRHSLVRARDESSVTATLKIGAHDSAHPGLVVREQGSGRVVYLSGALEDAYVQWLYLADPLGVQPTQWRMGYDHLPGLAAFMADVVAWGTREQGDLRTEPNADLLTVLAGKPGVRLLSLLNLSGPRHEQGRTVLEDRTVPLTDVTVRIRRTDEMRNATEFRLLRSRGSVPGLIVGDFVELTLPRLDDYEAVVLVPPMTGEPAPDDRKP